MSYPIIETIRPSEVTAKWYYKEVTKSKFNPKEFFTSETKETLSFSINSS